MRAASMTKTVAASAGLLAVTMVFNGCGARQTDASATKIRDGHIVQASSDGPERTATVGIRGQTDREAYTCSAAVLDDDLLVTAAHCVVDGAEIFAYFGTDMRHATKASQYTQVTNAVVHPDYRSHGEQTTPNDIAVLKLEEPVPASHHKIALLSPSQELKENSAVRLAGFGITERGNDSDVLRYVDTTYAGTDDEGRLVIEDAQKRGACSGDSGGPLFVQADGQWYLGGVLSGGPVPCRGLNVYTSVAANRDFLKAAVRTLHGS